MLKCQICAGNKRGLQTEQHVELKQEKRQKSNWREVGGGRRRRADFESRCQPSLLCHDYLAQHLTSVSHSWFHRRGTTPGLQKTKCRMRQQKKNWERGTRLKKVWWSQRGEEQASGKYSERLVNGAWMTRREREDRERETERERMWGGLSSREISFTPSFVTLLALGTQAERV